MWTTQEQQNFDRLTRVVRQNKEQSNLLPAIIYHGDIFKQPVENGTDYTTELQVNDRAWGIESPVNGQKGLMVCGDAVFICEFVTDQDTGWVVKGWMDGGFLNS